ncbi:MAG: YbaK/EbsC family protein [Rhodococcus sp.]|nr:YbaK/EbsC family protein [Rhodococcus sp. (in: high G+C Gram-positive bacteria)]
MSSPLHRNAAHVAHTLISRGHHGVIITRPGTLDRVADEAFALGVEAGAVVRSLVFLLDDDPVLLLVSGDRDVDLERTGKRLEGVLTTAPSDAVESLTRQPAGRIAPLGHPLNLPTYLDSALEAFPELWAAAGYQGSYFRTTFSELLRITAGLAIDVD